MVYEIVSGIWLVETIQYFACMVGEISFSKNDNYLIKCDKYSNDKS